MSAGTLTRRKIVTLIIKSHAILQVGEKWLRKGHRGTETPERVGKEPPTVSLLHPYGLKDKTLMGRAVPGELEIWGRLGHELPRVTI